MKYIEVKTTLESFEEAKNMSRILVEEKLVSCVQISEIFSVYTWKKEKVEGKEFLLIMKTNQKLFKKLEKRIKEIHSYEVAEVVALPVIDGSKEYFEWIDENTEE